MTMRWTTSVFGALLLFGLGLPANEVRAQSYSSQHIQLPPSINALVRTLLNGVSWRRRAEAAELLGQSGDPRVLEPLATAAAHDTSPEVRRASRDAIRQIRGDIAPPMPGPGPFPPPQPQDPNIALVDSWFQRYLSRSVDRGGIAAWVPLLQRGVPAEDVQAAILGSEEFWLKNGSRPAGFIVGLYQGVLGRTPNRDEIGNWGDRYNLHRGNRGAVAREFLEAAQTELLQRQQNQPYPY